MVAHGDKQVEEELASALLHGGLHGSAALKCTAAADDEGKVVGAQARVRVGRVGVRVRRRAQDGADINAGLETLLPEGEELELVEAVPVGGAVDDGVAQEFVAAAREIDGGLDCAGACGRGRGGGGRGRGKRGAAHTAGSPSPGGGVGGVDEGVRGRGGVGGPLVGRVLELPSVSVLVMDQAGVVVTLVEVLENGGEDLGFLVREGDPLTLHVVKLAPARGVEEGRLAEDIFVRGEKPTLATDRQSDDGRGGEGVCIRVSVGSGGGGRGRTGAVVASAARSTPGGAATTASSPGKLVASAKRLLQLR